MLGSSNCLEPCLQGLAVGLKRVHLPGPSWASLCLEMIKAHEYPSLEFKTGQLIHIQ